MILSLLGIPSIISSILNFATPILSSLLAFGGWYLKNMWEGSKVILANLSTFTVIGTVAIISAYYGSNLAFCEVARISKPVIETVKEWNPFDVQR